MGLHRGPEPTGRPGQPGRPERRSLLPVHAPSYRPHPLHGPTAPWAETNCATDMWIEVLHAFGFDPVAGLGFTLATGFDGEQWTMFTYPDEDLRELYGFEVHELNVWRRLVDHVEEHLALGHLVVVDVDAFHLPDTVGTTYRSAHQKTTIGIQMIDPGARVLGYFHNAGYAELDGEDFDGVMHLGVHEGTLAAALPPFALVAWLAHAPPGPGQQAGAVIERLATHLARRPADNPVRRLAARMEADLERLAADGIDAFHRYAFGTCRHLGANGALAGAFVDWLAAHDPHADQRALADAGARFAAVSSGATTAEFLLARAAAGRSVDLRSVMGPLQDAWAAAVGAVDACYGRCLS